MPTKRTLVLIRYRSHPSAAAMKFGKNLQRNQVPEWSSDYINYKGIKKLIKGAAQSYREGEEADLAGPFKTIKLRCDHS